MIFGTFVQLLRFETRSSFYFSCFAALLFGYPQFLCASLFCRFFLLLLLHLVLKQLALLPAGRSSCLNVMRLARAPAPRAATAALLLLLLAPLPSLTTARPTTLSLQRYNVYFALDRTPASSSTLNETVP